MRHHSPQQSVKSKLLLATGRWWCGAAEIFERQPKQYFIYMMIILLPSCRTNLRNFQCSENPTNSDLQYYNKKKETTSIMSAASASSSSSAVVAAAATTNDSAVIYHMCVISKWETATAHDGEYYPPTYEQDGFIHATKTPSTLLDTGNHFYKSTAGEWICLELDPTAMLSEVRYEAPAAVGDIGANNYGEGIRMPHIYGGLKASHVTKIFPIVRGEDGGFLSITGLVE